jgi:hypothetical protein
LKYAVFNNNIVTSKLQPGSTGGLVGKTGSCHVQFNQSAADIAAVRLDAVACRLVNGD